MSLHCRGHCAPGMCPAANHIPALSTKASMSRKQREVLRRPGTTQRMKTDAAAEAANAVSHSASQLSQSIDDEFKEWAVALRVQQASTCSLWCRVTTEWQGHPHSTARWRLRNHLSSGKSFLRTSLSSYTLYGSLSPAARTNSASIRPTPSTASLTNWANAQTVLVKSPTTTQRSSFLA